MPEAASKFIMKVSEPMKAWALLDRLLGNRDLTIVITITRLIMLRIPKSTGSEQVEALLQGMCLARAGLRVVQSEYRMLSGLGTIGRLV